MPDSSTPFFNGLLDDNPIDETLWQFAVRGFTLHSVTDLAKSHIHVWGPTMSTVSAPANSPGTHELHPLRNQWWCFLLLGIALIVLGTICIIEPLVPSLASVVFLGFLLMAAGITRIVSAFWAGKWSGMLLHVLIGVLYVAVGYMIVDAPVVNMVLITKFIAIFLIVSGTFRIVSAWSCGSRIGAGHCSTVASPCCWASSSIASCPKRLCG